MSTAQQFRDEERSRRAWIGARLHEQLIYSRVLLAVNLLGCFAAVGMTAISVIQGDVIALLWTVVTVVNFHLGRRYLSEYEATVGDIRLLEVAGGVMETLYNSEQ